jgi:glycosyltransferase involved in cell wall biosynthesis
VKSILFLTKYTRSGASSRYRTLQYLPFLEQKGFRCQVSALFDESYLSKRYEKGDGQSINVLGAFFRRVAALVASRKYDLLVIEYELLPYSLSFFERFLSFSGVSYVVDYDDALFHQYDNHRKTLIRLLLGGKIASVMRHAELVIAGNKYIADYARHSGAKKVAEIPTVVDLERYPVKIIEEKKNESFTIGWIGSPTTSKYLKTISPSLTEVCGHVNCSVKLIGSGYVNINEVPLEILEWSEESEVGSLNSFDLGIMPLPDEPWTLGKCGFKLIQYMACGLPVVASPVGVNKEIVEHGVNGFLAETHDEWVQALETLRNDHALRKTMGAAGRRKVEEKYCLQVTAPRYVELLQSMVEKR